MALELVCLGIDQINHIEHTDNDEPVSKETCCKK